MASTVALALDLEQAVARSLQRRAAREGVTPSALACQLLRQALAAETLEAAGTQSLAAVIQRLVRDGR